MDLGLKNRVVVVSGAARGIGAAVSRAFVEEGARVALLDRDAAAGEALAKELSDSLFVPVDLSAESGCREAIRAVQQQLGPVDVLVNNAGVNDAVPLHGPPVDFLASIHRNLLHVYELTHWSREDLVRGRGAIINIGSKVGFTGQGGTSGYAAAKGAIHALTREWAAALARHGVRVNAVIPAECDSDQYRQWFSRQPDPALARQKVADLVPLEARLTRPDEIADAVVWLASRRASHVTGQHLFVDGGYTHLDRALTSGHRW
jgi:L-fucose dehydrogenase